MLIDVLRKNVAALGILESSRRTGISRSILNNFAKHEASISAQNIEKLMELFEVRVTPGINLTSLSQTPCDPSKKIDIVKIAKILKNVYQAKEVILFGSQVKGTWNKESDIDFLVVRHNDTKNIDPGQEHVVAFEQNIDVSFDVVTISEKDLKDSKKAKAPVIRDALAHGVRLYE